MKAIDRVNFVRQIIMIINIIIIHQQTTVELAVSHKKN